MPQPFFSVIIPVFKTEAFLEQCLESIKAQTFRDFECLVVSDGSIGVDQKAFEQFQDEHYKAKIDFSKISGSKQVEYIFNQIVGQDKRFELIMQENGGASSARNAAIEQASGQWILPVDSDDWLETEHLTEFYSKISKHTGSKIPIVHFIQTHFYNTGKLIETYIPKQINLASAIHSSTFWSMSTAYNLGILNRHKLRFDLKLGRGSNPKIRISDGGEDFLFAYQYLEAIEKDLGQNSFEVICIPATTYKYREIFVAEKKQIDNMGSYNYAKYFQQFGFQNPAWNIKTISFILPFWTKLRYYHNPLATLLRKFLSLLMRLISW